MRRHELSKQTTRLVSIQYHSDLPSSLNSSSRLLSSPSPFPLLLFFPPFPVGYEHNMMGCEFSCTLLAVHLWSRRFLWRLPFAFGILNSLLFVGIYLLVSLQDFTYSISRSVLMLCLPSSRVVVARKELSKTLLYRLPLLRTCSSVGWADGRQKHHF
jgi:hypothetical protein